MSNQKYGIKFIIKESRPKGARNCGSYITCSNKLSKSYGMPSGHSQSMGVILGFWLCYMWYDELMKDDTKHNQHSKKYIGSLLLLMICIWVPYSRVLLGCHSVAQVITGFIIGVSIGISSYIIYDNYIK